MTFYDRPVTDPTHPRGTVPASRPAGTLAQDRQMQAVMAKARASQVVLEPVRDEHGRVSSQIPLPRNWQLQEVAPGKYRITAPGGIFVHPTNAQTLRLRHAPAVFALVLFVLLPTARA